MLGTPSSVPLLLPEPVQPLGFEWIRDKADLRSRELPDNPAEPAAAGPRRAYQSFKKTILTDLDGRRTGQSSPSFSSHRVTLRLLDTDRATTAIGPDLLPLKIAQQVSQSIALCQSEFRIFNCARVAVHASFSAVAAISGSHMMRSAAEAESFSALFKEPHLLVGIRGREQSGAVHQQAVDLPQNQLRFIAF